MGVLLAFSGLLVVAGPTVSASGAEFGIVPGSFKARMLDAEGNPEDRAGSHPDRLQIDFGLAVEGTGTTPRDLIFELPPGFGGNPGAVPECQRARFEAGEECPPQSQVGLLRFVLSGGQELKLPIFELEPGPDEFLAFASIPSVEVPLSTELRPGDFGITLKASDIASISLSEGHVELWGVPADHQQGTGIPPRPFLTAPSHCGPIPFTLRVRSWQEGAQWLSASTDAEAPLVDCQSLSFKPQLGLQLTNPVADSPSGLRMDIDTPEDPEGSERSSAQIEDIDVAMPDGVTVSPGGVQGIVACSDAQLDVGSTAAALCPAASKIGAVELSSPVLHGALVGTVYLGAERPGERFRLFIVVPAPGAVIKFTGSLHADLLTGRLSATLADLPEVPIHHLGMRLGGGAESMLATPLACGATAARGRFVPYGGGSPFDSSVSLAIAGAPLGAPCVTPPPFAPKLLTSASQPEAGHLSSFSVTMLRQDGEQLPRRFSVSMPKGMSAALGAVQVCSEGAVVAGSCLPASRVGGVLAKVGSGPNPALLRGSLFLTGPYRRAPFGVLMQIRADLGPFDLGTIAFRATANLDARSGRVTIATDLLPEAIEGVPVRFQQITLDMDRPGFIRNPTSCDPARVDAAIEASGGASVAAASSFGLRGCKRLGLRPRFHLAFEDSGALHRGDKPGLRVTARLRKGDTNLRALKLSLPKALRFDASGLGEICSQRDAIDGACGEGAQVGTAIARTGLVNKPLRGGIYVAQPTGQGQPDFWLDLGAMGVQVELRGRSAIRHGHLATDLLGLPDIPLSALSMRFAGGQKGAFALAVDLCSHGRARQLASTVDVTGQNGAQRSLSLPIEAKDACR